VQFSCSSQSSMRAFCGIAETTGGVSFPRRGGDCLRFPELEIDLGMWTMTHVITHMTTHMRTQASRCRNTGPTPFRAQARLQPGVRGGAVAMPAQAAGVGEWVEEERVYGRERLGVGGGVGGVGAGRGPL